MKHTFLTWRISAPLMLAIFSLPFFLSGFFWQAAVRAEGVQGAGGSLPHPECAYFTEFPKHSARGASRLQRIEIPRQPASAGIRTQRAAKAVTDRSPSEPLSMIDFHIFATLERQGVAPADPATDTEFLRRVTLDLTGRIPSAEEVVAFVADSGPQKRSRVIDRLLDSPEWVDRWTMWFGDLLKNSARSTQISRFNQGRDAFNAYIRESLQENRPYNRFVYELIASEGNNFEDGKVNFVVGGLMPMAPLQDTYDKQWAETARTFLGLKNFDCLLCHNGAGHLDAVNLWGSQVTRAEAWGMAAFFSRTRAFRDRRSGQNGGFVVQDRRNGGYQLNTDSGNRPVRQPWDGQSATVAPVYLFSGRQPARGENYRQALAEEVTVDFQFARAAVNYIWEHFFTAGIVDPSDAFDLARLDPNNPPPEPWTLQPSHPELLEDLARFFVLNDYDLKALMREICNSAAYQLSSRYEGEWNPAYERLFARHLVRRLDSEELHDALAKSSGILGNMRLRGSRQRIPWAMQLPDTVEPRGQITAFLNTFLRGDRDENPRRDDLSASQALDLMNDDVVTSRVQASSRGGLLSRLLAARLNDAQLAEALYLNLLSRYPSNEELSASVQVLRSGDRRSRAEDLAWSLYNKVDFIMNY